MHKRTFTHLHHVRHALGAWLATALLLCGLPAHAADVRFEPVAEGVYAFIGEMGARTVANEGLNANLGLVVTPAGAVLIDSGATFQGARQVEAAARTVTTQPIRWVINTGGQDHRWLGNGYFRAQGAEIMAHAQAEADMRSRGGEQLAGLQGTLGQLAEGTTPVLPTRWLRGADERLEFGGVVLELKHRGGAHTPGDVLVWLPQRKVLFTGDVVYVDRLLGVMPMSSTKAWLATFDAIEQLAPVVIVPGHGQVCDLAKARAQTRDYLRALRAHMKQAVDEGLDMSTAIKTFHGAPWAGLLNAAELMPGNASRAYLELERE